MIRAVALACVAATACGHASPTRSRADDAALVTAVADDYVRRYIEASPEETDLNAWPEARHDRFSDRSPAGIAAWNRTVDELLARIAGVDEERLFGDPAWLTLGFLREALERDRGARVCRDEL